MNKKYLLKSGVGGAGEGFVFFYDQWKMDFFSFLLSFPDFEIE